MKKIIVGADRSGRSLKDALVEYLESVGYEVKDVGAYAKEEFVPYYEIASKVAEGIQNNEYQKGILFCGTGMGMSIVANKFKGVYASAVESRYSAKMCKAINNANVITMGGWVTAPFLAVQIVEAWLSMSFTQKMEFKKDFLTNAFENVLKIEDKNFS